VPVASITQTLFIYFRKQAWKTDVGPGGVTGPQAIQHLSVEPPPGV
jgi:hypothetical protein